MREKKETARDRKSGWCEVKWGQVTWLVVSELKVLYRT